MGTVSHPSNNALTATNGNFTGTLTVVDDVSIEGSTPTLSLADTDVSNNKVELNYDEFLTIDIDPNNARGNTGLIVKGDGTERMRLDSIGALTIPQQPAFLAVPTPASGGTTNMSTNTTIVFGTEKFDQNGDFASNTFTAPVTGKYQLNFMARVDQIDVDSNWSRLVLVTSNTTYESQIIDLGGLSGDPSYWMFNINVLADMDANDTAFIKYQQDGGAAQTDVTEQAFFSGYLAC